MGAGDAESAAVLTPYNGQVRLIRSILKSRAGDLYNKVRCPMHQLCTCCAPVWQPCDEQEPCACSIAALLLARCDDDDMVTPSWQTLQRPSHPGDHRQYMLEQEVLSGPLRS